MIARHTIGEISLSVSTFFYVCWFLPQIILNFKRKSTEGLSFGLHVLLLTGYCCDLIYGFGLHMQWQYRLVTMAGLLSLLIQHFQIAYYGFNQKIKKLEYVIVSIFFAALFVITVLIVIGAQYSSRFYDGIGIITNICYTIYMAPQIWQNYKSQSTVGLSRAFVLLTIFLCSCDLTSAYTLSWHWPNFLGSTLEIMGNLLLLYQIYFYSKKIGEFSYA